MKYADSPPPVAVESVVDELDAVGHDVGAVERRVEHLPHLDSILSIDLSPFLACFFVTVLDLLTIQRF